MAVDLRSLDVAVQNVNGLNNFTYIEIFLLQD